MTSSPFSGRTYTRRGITVATVRPRRRDLTPSSATSSCRMVCLSRSRPPSAATTASRPGPSGNSSRPRRSRSTAPRPALPRELIFLAQPGGQTEHSRNRPSSVQLKVKKRMRIGTGEHSHRVVHVTFQKSLSSPGSRRQCRRARRSERTRPLAWIHRSSKEARFRSGAGGRACPGTDRAPP
jgi:hypothetical protein